MDRREFLKKTYQIGGLSALYSLGLSHDAIARIVGGGHLNVNPYSNCSQLGTSEFFWCGDHSSGNTYACKSGGTVQGTLTDGEIVASSSDPGSGDSVSNGNVLKLDANGETLTWPISSGDIFSSSEYLFEAYVYISAHTSAQYLFLAYYDGTNFMRVRILSTGALELYHLGGSDTAYVDSGEHVISAESWTYVAWRGKTADNAIGVKVGANDWDVETGDTVTDFATEPSTIQLGGSTIVDTIYVDDLRGDSTSGI